ncbi:MAG: CPBP family intramembrane glutamic endopeptidase [Ignisphaera sp.]
MEKRLISRIAVFTLVSYTSAFILDYTALLGLFTTGWGATAWGFLRMWSVALSAVLCLAIYREGVAIHIKHFLKPSKKALVGYLTAPLIVYGALTIYILIALPLKLFDFGVYVKIIAEALRTTLPSLSEDQLTNLATTAAYSQILAGYVAAVTINAFFALGEEIGWRGYLYRILGARPTLYNIIVVGILWGLWHSPAILLLGYNYSVNRSTGVLLFTLYTIFLTYPHLLVTTATDSILPATTLHGAVNALWGLTIVASNLPIELKETLLGLGVLGIAAWSITCILLYIAYRYRRK